MNQTAPMNSLPLDETLRAAYEATERVRRVLAYIHSDLTGSDYPNEAEEPPVMGVVDLANRLRNRLDGIADALPQLRAVISSPEAAQLAKVNYAVASGGGGAGSGLGNQMGR